MCLLLEHQNPSKTSEKKGYFDRVTVSLHILYIANQETEGSQDRLLGTSCLGHPSGEVLCVSEDMACGYWFSKWRTTKSISVWIIERPVFPLSMFSISKTPLFFYFPFCCGGKFLAICFRWWCFIVDRNELKYFLKRLLQSTFVVW